MSEPKCRWGILGAAQIARKNWQAIGRAENCRLAAVASRDLARCRQFIKECQSACPVDPAPLACHDYEDLLRREDVDAVYIPLPTALRKDWTIRAAEAGKHVLIEKPAGATTKDVEDILEACRKHNVQFMDGVMFMHSRRLQQMRKVLDDEACFGRLNRIASEFSFGAPEAFFQTDIRTDSRLEPLGCLGDLGWYNVRFILWAMNWQLPLRVCGHLLTEHRRPDSPLPVPTDFSAELYYPEGVSASFCCSFRTGIQQWAMLSGTRGAVYIPDFVLPSYGSEVRFDLSNPVFRITGSDFNMEPHTRRFAVSEYSNSSSSAQETSMFRNFSKLVLSGTREPFWGEIALKTQRVVDACLKSARSGGETLAV